MLCTALYDNQKNQLLHTLDIKAKGITRQVPGQEFQYAIDSKYDANTRTRSIPNPS